MPTQAIIEALSVHNFKGGEPIFKLYFLAKSGRQSGIKSLNLRRKIILTIHHYESI